MSHNHNIPTIRLSNGLEMPMYGLGLSHHGGFNPEAVHESLRHGIRLYDTAKRYGSEEPLAQAISSFKKEHARDDLPDSLFITSKLWPGDANNVRNAFQESLERLGGKLDLYLVHWPGPWPPSGHQDHRQLAEFRVQVWREIEKLYDEGKTKAIGVSNFLEQHMQDLLDSEEVSNTPMLNQIEFNPLQYPAALLEQCKSNNIAVEGYCPLAKGNALDHPTVEKVANEVGADPAKVLLRWSLQHNVITIPKTTKPARVEANLECLNISLSDSQMQALNSINEDFRATWDPTIVA